MSGVPSNSPDPCLDRGRGDGQGYRGEGARFFGLLQMRTTDTSLPCPSRSTVRPQEALHLTPRGYGMGVVGGHSLMIDSKQTVAYDRATASRNRRTGAVSSGNATPPAGTSATAAGLLNPPNAMAYNSLSKGPSGSRIRPEVPASQPMSPLGLGYFTFVRRRWPSGPAKPATSAVRASRQIRSSSPGVICERSSTAESPSHSA